MHILFTMIENTPYTALQRAIAGAGSKASLARELGVSRQAVTQWLRVPAERTLEVERLGGVSRHELRPDLYPLDYTWGSGVQTTPDGE